MRFTHYLNENEKQLYKDVLKFRKDQENYYDWEFDKKCFKNPCQDISRDLVDYLIKLGYKAQRKGGYYNPPEEWFEEESEDYKDGKWKHWWVLVNNKWIVDVTADQFHPSEEAEYRVIVTKKNDPDYG